MRWRIRVAGLVVAAVALLVPLAAQAAPSRMHDAPPLEGAPTTTATPPADPPEGQVVTIVVPAEPEQTAPPMSKPKPKPKPKAPVEARTEPVSPPASPYQPAAETTTAVVVRSRGGASRVLTPPPARGGPSFTQPVARSRQTASVVSAELARHAVVASSGSHKVSRALIAVLGAAAFIEALLITRMMRRRRLVSYPGPAGGR